MSASQGVFFVPGMSSDPRIRVFRRKFSASGEFEGIVHFTARYTMPMSAT